MLSSFFSSTSALILLSATCLFIPNCFALQTINIADNQTKSITIAADELSRIFVIDDRIQNVRGLEGAYLLTQDTKQGQIFIKPTSAYTNRPFNIFISTEKGRNFNLIIKTKELSGQDIALKSTTPSNEAAKWEEASEYHQTLSKLISSMITGEVPIGYSVVYPTKKIKPIKYTNKTTAVTLTLQKTYFGKHLRGEVLLVQNLNNQSSQLIETNFYRPGTRAIALLEDRLPAKGQTMLFRVISND
jgi:conjugal transfer pilus assembly protein TraK